MAMSGREKLEGLDYIPAIEVRRVCTQTQQKQWPHLPQWAITRAVSVSQLGCKIGG